MRPSGGFPTSKAWWVQQLRRVLNPTAFLVPTNEEVITEGTTIDVGPGSALLLDQTAPQTVTGGAPIFSEGLTCGSPGFFLCDGHIYLGMTDPTADLTFNHYCDGISAYLLRSTSSNYSQFSFGLNTALGYVFLQSNHGGSGATLPLSFWIGSARTWDIDTSGHLMAGGDGSGVRNIKTTGDIEATSFILKSPNGTRYKIVVDNAGVLSTVPA
jgi:hypothetical protein